MKLLKLCNIKNIFETRTAASLGIQFLGYHLISENDFKRYDAIKQCVSELRKYYPNTHAILVTKEQDVNKIVPVIEEVEFDGVQLHYSDSNSQSSALKGHFGSTFIVVQVVSQDESIFKPSQADYVLIDKSYVGGTGKQVSQDQLDEIISKVRDVKTLLAGGISNSNLYQYLETPVDGFDIQSAIKSEKSTTTENSDFTQMFLLARLLGYKLSLQSGQVGFAIQDVNQQNHELLEEAIKGSIDFFHIDISDGFVGKVTDLQATKKLMNAINSINSHLRMQIHFFVSSQAKFENIYHEINLNNSFVCEIFVHVNRDNYSSFDPHFVSRDNIYFGLDVKDVIDESYPWEQFVKEQLLVCLQSKEHGDRIVNLNRGLKLIRYSTKEQPIITLDRSVDSEVVLNLEDSNPTNVVCGSYLRENISERYQHLKKYLHDRNEQ
ncbi:hypothetical protein CO180_04480 [candidate division WWE3 bacterium CG_4_9_14_3_um_filter_41_6]|uniref:N-(5'-phosphoribosyl)anthranilate isomerase n=1 Tax=candidate division WWE3 bacterium CG_4_10_14_0_2_um_filter_41_14 TaxID=1975072 RepID=A0A2M7TJN9_UNCKA|nr:MAG: hypothetical protein COY32_03425 [candidate division WWE3 bacterium CG_4_10_14_0_2_um_filter_41_14]PJA38004.1 MAG: hypothetical protein CO180_04480 [candidate division WWE3 bacterium CG_4_9_14_3_um_filter_41_6]